MEGLYSSPEIEHLKVKIAEKFAHKLTTTNDFDLLSMVMEHELSECVSSTTLKRMWAYVNLHPTPRSSTLDVLARYIGKKNFKHFCEDLKQEEGHDSDFFTAKCISVSDLKENDILSLGWDPNRHIRIQYRGSGKFQVLESFNSKFMKDDIFESSCFILGDPLVISRILRNGEYTSAFIAGRKGGLKYMNLENSKS